MPLASSLAGWGAETFSGSRGFSGFSGASRFARAASRKYSFCDHRCRPSPSRIAHRLIASDEASFNRSPSVFFVAGFSTSPTSSTYTVRPSTSTVRRAMQPTISGGSPPRMIVRMSNENGPTAYSSRWVITSCET